MDWWAPKIPCFKSWSKMNLNQNLKLKLITSRENLTLSISSRYSGIRKIQLWNKKWRRSIWSNSKWLIKSCYHFTQMINLLIHMLRNRLNKKNWPINYSLRKMNRKTYRRYLNCRLWASKKEMNFRKTKFNLRHLRLSNLFQVRS